MIRFGMALMEMIEQLTKGFVKATGRQPDNLEKLKIQQEAVQRFKDMNKVVDMKGRTLDPSKPIMGGTQEGAALRSGIMKATGAKPKSLVDDAIDNVSPGFVKGDRKYNAQLVAEDLAEKKFGKEFYDLDPKQQIDLYDEALKGLSDDFAQGGRAGFVAGGITNLAMRLARGFMKVTGRKPNDEELMKIIREAAERDFAEVSDDVALKGVSESRATARRMDDIDKDELKKAIDEYKIPVRTQEEFDFAQGGIARLGLKEGSGMTRRTFLKLLGGMAAVPIVGKFFKLAKVGQKVKQVPVIKTDDVAGKPEWFDALVNKVITEGDDVTKRFATGERQSIHQKKLDDGSVVRVTEDVDDGAVRVEYESDKNVFGDDVQLQYKKPLPDEGAPSPKAEFEVAESGPVGRQSGPDDFDIEVDEVGGTSIRDLDSDVSKLKEYATGKKPTMQELVQNIKRREKAAKITEGGDEMIDAVTRRQGDYVPEPDDFASGGIARMLGE